MSEGRYVLVTASMKMETNLGSGGAGLLGALGKIAKSAVTASLFSATSTVHRALQVR